MKETEPNPQKKISSFKVSLSVLKIFQLLLHFYIFQLHRQAFWWNLPFVNEYFPSINELGMLYSFFLVFVFWTYDIRPFYIFMTELAFLAISVNILCIAFVWEVHPNYDTALELATIEDEMKILETILGPIYQEEDPEVGWINKFLRKKSQSIHRTQSNEIYYISIAVIVTQLIVTYFVLSKYSEIDKMMELSDMKELKGKPVKNLNKNKGN